MKAKFFSIFLLFFIVSASIYSQSAKIMDKIISSQALSCGDACYIAGIMAGTIGDDASPIEALEKFRGVKGLEKVSMDDLIRYDVFASLIMYAGKVRDSIWYNLYKNPHYAFRYFKTIGLVDAKTFPSSNVSPRDAMFIISKLSEEK